jgi:alkanesulfonate monooxygenase SsuD/methylene tetrahydromethanopterin reductase-like flavin-dependent oxidoreductase (luciferase family)
VEIGVHLPQVDILGEGLTSTRLLRVVETARRLEFVAVAANDHFTFARPWLDGLVALSQAAPDAGEMDLMTTIALPVLRGPLPVAAAMVALDHLSSGRVIAGVGVGSSRADYDLAGISFDERWQRFDQALAILRSLLQGESSLRRTQLDLDAPASSASGSDADPGIPVWVASWGSPAGLRRVARLGDGWMASAYNTDPDRFAAGRRAIAAERDRLGHPPSEIPAAVVTMWTWITDASDEGEHMLADVLAPMLGRPADDLRGRVCVGSAQQCAELLSRYAAAGCRRVNVWPVGDEERQLELLAEQVLPKIAP